MAGWGRGLSGEGGKLKGEARRRGIWEVRGGEVVKEREWGRDRVEWEVVEGSWLGKRAKRRGGEGKGGGEKKGNMGGG